MTSERLAKADWSVRAIPRHWEAEQLIRAGHYSRSCPNTSTYRHGLYRVADGFMAMPLGAALWIPPTRSAGEAIAGDDWQGVLALSRLVCLPEVPSNAASFLLGRSIRLIDAERWPVLVTYADTGQGHTGAIYRATNWRCDGPVAAGDVWQNERGELMGRKRGGRTRLAEEMVAAGFTKRPALPKIRFVLDRRRAAAQVVALDG